MLEVAPGGGEGGGGFQRGSFFFPSWRMSVCVCCSLLPPRGVKRGFLFLYANGWFERDPREGEGGGGGGLNRSCLALTP